MIKAPRSWSARTGRYPSSSIIGRNALSHRALKSTCTGPFAASIPVGFAPNGITMKQTGVIDMWLLSPPQQRPTKRFYKVIDTGSSLASIRRAQPQLSPAVRVREVPDYRQLRAADQIA